MKKLLLASLCFLMLCMTQAYSQSRSVTGTVTAKEDGLPLPGVSVKVKGTTIGTQTNAGGKFTLSVPANGVLVFSFVGYNAIEITPKGPVADAILEANSKQLSEVLITTAFGIKREERSVGYNATTITDKDLTEAAPTNFTNGLAGKVAGLVVSTVDNSINPATRFTLRGNRHITGNNYALVILNGVPISPNDVNTINPDDIESTTILEGAGAAALYGSEASNGALVITTKKGTASGAPSIVYANTFQFEKISYFPALQTEFGSYGGEGVPYQNAITGFITTPVPFENQSYGPAYTGALTQLGIPLQNGTIQQYPYSTPKVDPRYAFFNTGHTEQNDIRYASGDADNNFAISANRLDRVGTIPGDSYQRTIARLTAGHTYGIFKLDFTASYAQSYTSQGPSVYSTLLNTPSWVPLENFKNITAPFSDPSTFFNSYDVNPYASLANNRTNSRSDNFNGSLTGTLTPTKWLDIMYRVADNFGISQSTSTTAEIDYTPYALSDPTGGYGTIASTKGVLVTPGSVSNTIQFGDGTAATGAGPQGFSRITQDIILNFHKTFFTDFKANLRGGATVWQEYLNQIANSSSNLFINGFYNIGYISGVPATSQYSEKIRQTGYFADFSLSYKNFAFVEGTIRNEHDSRLNATNRSIYYPSVNASLVLTDMINALKDNKVLNYLKVRGSFAQVGDVNVSPYTYQPNSYSATSGFPYGNLTALTLSSTLNNPYLKPEKTIEYETGLEFGLFDNRITGSATYYTDHTTNQTLNITTSPTIGYTGTLVNVGDVLNNGFEFKLNVEVLSKAKNKVGLTLGGNLAIQNSKVISLVNGLNSIALGSGLQAIVGSPYPELVGSDVARDPSGHVIVSASTGYPSTAPALVNLGRTTPKYILGLNQTVSYKFMSLTAISEFRTGYVIENGALSSATAAGSSLQSASAGRERFIFPNSVINTGTAANPVYTPNTNVAVADGNLGFWDSGAYYSATSSYVTSGAFWKLREADLAFDLTSFVKKSKAIKKATFSLNGRNLVMLRPKTNNSTDPEFSNTTGNAVGVNTTAQLPPTRIFGGTLSLTF